MTRKELNFTSDLSKNDNDNNNDNINNNDNYYNNNNDNYYNNNNDNYYNNNNDNKNDDLDTCRSVQLHRIQNIDGGSFIQKLAQYVLMFPMFLRENRAQHEKKKILLLVSNRKVK